MSSDKPPAIFHVIRHAHAVSNHRWAQGEKGHEREFQGVPLPEKEEKEGPLGGERAFSVPLSAEGVRQCLFDPNLRVTLDEKKDGKIKKIYASALDRAVHTAILATPFEILKGCNFTITIIPHIQEAIKYQCDLFSSKANLELQADRMKEQYARLLDKMGQQKNAKVLRKEGIKIVWEDEGWTYTGKVCGTDTPVSPWGVVTETVEMLSDRAKAARDFFRKVAANQGDQRSQFLIYTHGQFLEWFTRQFQFQENEGGQGDKKFANLARLQMFFDKDEADIEDGPDENDKPKAMLKLHSCTDCGKVRPLKTGPLQEESAVKDAKKRIKQGCEAVRWDVKKKYIEKMGRTAWSRNDHKLGDETPNPSDLAPKENPRYFLVGVVDLDILKFYNPTTKVLAATATEMLTNEEYKWKGTTLNEKPPQKTSENA